MSTLDGQVIALRSAPVVLAGLVPACSTPPSRDGWRLPHRGRPGDRLEHRAAPGDLLARLQQQADALRLPLVTAGCVLVEQRLIVAELGDGAADGPAARQLDQAAAAACVTCALSDTSALYLRALHGQQAAPAHNPDMVGAELPTRLGDRILQRGGLAGLLGGQLAEGEVERSRRWEVAAVLSGGTMTEWSLFTLLSAAGR